MAISKSTPYVRYKKDFMSSLHLGTIHIESEYLDRTQKTTIESIHGMTWHNKVVNENKELNLLSDTQLELTELEKQYWNTGEKRVSVDEIHTLEEVEPNENGTYTYTVNSMEGEYIEIYDGINNITSTSDGLDGQFEIVYDTTEEDINGNIALDQVVSQYEITDSGVGTIIGAKSTGLTLVNHITEPSKEEVAAIEQQEGQHFTINNTVQGNIKSAILKGDTALNRARKYSKEEQEVTYIYNMQNENVVSNNPTPLLEGQKIYMSMEIKISELSNDYPHLEICTMRGTGGYSATVKSNAALHKMPKNAWIRVSAIRNVVLEHSDNQYSMVVIVNNSSVTNVAFGKIATRKPMWINLSEKFGMGNEPTREQCDEMFEYFEGMQSVKMPVLKTVGKNLFDYTHWYSLIYPVFDYEIVGNKISATIPVGMWFLETKQIDFSELKMNTVYTISGSPVNSEITILFWKPDGAFIFERGVRNTPITFRTPNEPFVVSMRFCRRTSSDNSVAIQASCENIQIEEGSVATSFEPYKSSILTCNEEVELRGIGEVQDELNLETGELTQRTGKIILNGTEPWWEISTGRFAISEGFLENVKKPNDMWTIQMMCEGATVVTYYDEIVNGGVNVIAQPNENYDFVMRSEIDDINEFKEYLKNNPVTVYYQLATESVKTVDLTVQNQDGGIIPHIQTQQGITHVSTSSHGLIPTVEMSCSYDTIIKPNTTYTIKLDRPIVSDTMYLQVDLGGTMMMLDADVNAFTIKTPSTLSHSQLRLSGTGNTVKEIIVLEGNRVNDKIEYFEGMKNVENPILIVSNCPYVFGKGGRI